MRSEETQPETPARLEYPACPLCGNDRREFSFCLEEPYKIACCTGCGVHYLFPRLTETAIQDVYRQSSYYEGGTCGYADTSYSAQESALRATFKRLLQNLGSRGLTGGDFLEIGCGYGYLLDEAHGYFDRRVATEFSPEGAEIARGTGAEVFIGGVEQIPAERKFDCVIAIQVIEHIYQPFPFVEQLVKRVKPGGSIVLATPDMGGVLRRAMGRRWPSFKVPEHVIYFDFRTLSELMKRTGLSNIRRLRYPHAFPLGLITAKFGLTMPPALARLKIWVPATTVAAYGRVPHV